MPTTRWTLSDLRDALRARIGATEGAARFWTDYDLDVNIREAFRSWNRLTGQWRGRVVLATTADDPFVTLPSTLTWAARVEWQGTSLEPVGLHELDDAWPGWQSAPSGVPTYWVPVALNLIALASPPATAKTSLVVDGILQTPLLTADTSEVDLDAPLVPILLDYARHLGSFRLGGDVWQISQATRAAFWQAAGDRNQQLQATALFARTIGRREDGTTRPFRAGPGTFGWKPDLPAVPTGGTTP
jgi:hypothetical protein